MNKTNHIKFEKLTFDAIICIDGDLPEKRFFEEFLELTLIAADGAANSLISNDIIPKYVVGDLDSVNTQLLTNFSDKIQVIEEEDQDKNDFEKTLVLARSLNLKNLLVVGFHGGELEHTINNLSVFKKFSEEMNLVIYDLKRYGFFINDENILDLNEDEIISLIPQPKVKLNTENLKWNLSNEYLELGKREGARNRTISNQIKISVIEGDVLFFCDSRLPFVPEKF